MVVPADCVNYSNGDAYVYTYDAATSTAKKTPVEDGLIDSDKIQIVSGLSYDDEVITSWSKELYDGAAVNIQAVMMARKRKPTARRALKEIQTVVRQQQKRLQKPRKRQQNKEAQGTWDLPKRS